MAILHAVRCRDCECVEESFHVEHRDYGTCPQCGSRKRTWLPRGFHTDVYGAPKYSDASGQLHSSHRDKVKHLKEAGFTECGDAVHGGRVDLRIKRTAFTGLGLERQRSSTGERTSR